MVLPVFSSLLRNTNTAFNDIICLFSPSICGGLGASGREYQVTHLNLCLGNLLAHFEESCHKLGQLLQTLHQLANFATE